MDISNRQSFHNELPDSTHIIDCFDAQPISGMWILISKIAKISFLNSKKDTFLINKR